MCKDATKAISLLQLGAGPLMWQQRSPRTRLIGEDSTSLKSSQRMLMTTAQVKMWKTRRQVKMMIAQTRTRQNRKPKQEQLTTWKPPNVETQSVLQLHFEDGYRRRCEQKIRLDIVGSMTRLRKHQQVLHVTINVGRNELHIKKDIDRIHQNLQHPSVQQMEKLFREKKVSDEATEALKHFSCDACDQLKEPPTRRQVAIAHARDVE